MYTSIYIMCHVQLKDLRGCWKVKVLQQTKKITTGIWQTSHWYTGQCIWSAKDYLASCLSNPLHPAHNCAAWMYSLVVPKCENWIVVSLGCITFHFMAVSWPWTVTNLTDGIILWHINALPMWPTECRTKWVLIHQAYSLDSWPRNFHTFGLWKNAHKHTSHDDVQESVVWLIRQQPKEFFADRIKWLVHQCGDISKLLQYAHLWTSSNGSHSHFKDILEQK